MNTCDITGRWPRVPPSAAAWLMELCGDDGLTGFMPPAMPDAVWVLHAMYEHERGPMDVTHHEYLQARMAEGSIEPQMIGGIDFNTVGIATGGDSGRAEHPGPGWRRLYWAQLARRVGDPLVAEGQYPGFECFPSVKRDGSWPLGIRPPTEGSLDRDTWNRLIAILIAHSPTGVAAGCLAYYCPMSLRLDLQDYENLHVRAGILGDAEALYDNPETGFSPANLWAQDHSWAVCTDYDLWATKVAGPTSLIDTLLSDNEIEAIRLP